MKAIVMNEYGNAGVLKYEDVAKPVPADNEVLIRVKATALNPIDSKIRNGYLQAVMPIHFPFTPGWEAAGIIEAAGKNVTSLRAGDEVYTRPNFRKAGSYAEYMTVDENEVALKPKSLSFTAAAAMPLVAGSAYTILFKTANVKAGQRIFILGAAGSVGLFAVQMAKLAGAYVIGTATGDDIAMLQSLGIDEAIDYNKAGYADGVSNIDLALDLAGGPAYENLWKTLKKGGTLLSTTMQPSPGKAKEYGVTASQVITGPDKAALEEIAALTDKGKLTPKVGKVLPLSEAAEAHKLMDEHRVKGKIILEIN
ncbi:MAG TPA: NADP-dependent oxidoreductase [Chitinophagaceae bacterium]